jgi:hypothetical protein
VDCLFIDVTYSRLWRDATRQRALFCKTIQPKGFAMNQTLDFSVSFLATELQQDLGTAKAIPDTEVLSDLELASVGGGIGSAPSNSNLF